MNFIYPNFLWALFFIAIPIIIHLFYFRRYKTVYFSNTSLLSEVKDERSSRNKLKHLLVLLSRILAIIFLVLAFAQPFFKSSEKQKIGEKQVSIYIDNSFSMKAEGNGQLLFDEGKNLAQEIINSYSENDKFQIITNDFEGKHQRLVNKTEAKSFVKDLKISSSLRTSKTVFERQKTIFKNNELNNIVYQISDFQANNVLLKNDTNIQINIVKLQTSEQRNVYIDSVWFTNSFQLKDATNKMVVKFRNESNENTSGNYQLILNEQAKTIGEYKIDKNSFSLDTLTFKIADVAWNSGKIQISDYPITYDDTYFYSFFVEDKVNVLNITEDDKDNVFQAVFKEIKNVNYQAVKFTKLDYNKLAEQHFIILDKLKTLPTGLSQSLKKYVENGGSVFIVPNKQIAVESYNVLLSGLKIGIFSSENNSKRAVTNLNLKHYILNDLFENTPRDIKLPNTSKHYLLKTKVNSQEEKILSFSNKDSYLSSFTVSSGNVFLLSAPIDKTFSDFTSNALFAPIVYKMAVFGVNNTNLSFEINANTTIKLKNKPTNFEDVVKMKNEEIEFIPQKNMFGGFLTLSLLNRNIKAGIYDVFTDNKLYKSKIALNYSRSESILKYYSVEELKKKYLDSNIKIISGSKTTIQEQIINNKQGKMLWKWFIVFALIFLAVEVLLLRFLK